MKIVNHRLSGTPFRKANASGGEMRPSLIVLHDTAGRLEPKSSVNWFASEDCPNSAHVVIERDGSITQMVEFDHKAWHAGPSSWKGRQYCNSFSIGIEIVSPGKLDQNGRAWFHKKTEPGFPLAILQRVKTAAHGDGWWMAYTPEQISVTIELCKALCEAYEIKDITTHWEISPGRKVDTGPLFPLARVRAEVLGKRHDPVNEAVSALNGSPAVAAAVANESADEPLAPLASPETAVAATVAEPSRGWLDRFGTDSLYHLNELAGQASRLATSVRGGLSAMWRTILSVLGVGGAVVGGNTVGLLDPNKGAPAVAEQALRPFPVVMVVVITVMLTTVIVGGIALLYLKRAKKGVVSASKDGRYTPLGAPKEAAP